MDRTALTHQLLAKPFPQRLVQAAAAVGHEQEPPKRKAAVPQIAEQRFADLVIFR